jgi:hypothetical protein
LINATDSVTWKSGNLNIAKVDTKGVDTAKKKGSCTITAVSNGKQYKCKITVKNVSKNSAFKQELLKNISSGLSFSLLDINQDGSKELLIKDDSYGASSDWKVYIYTFSKGKLNKLDVCGYGELSYYKASKCLINDIEGYGSLSEDGEPDTWTEYYTIKNGKAVYSKEITCKGEGSELSWYTINTDNINKYFK